MVFHSSTKNTSRKETPVERSLSINSRLTFLNISHNYGNIAALRNVNMDLGHNEVICVLGPSGCGKSTLLRAAAGVLNPTEGRIFVDGLEMSGPNIFVPAEHRGIGLVFQDYALFPNMSVIKNVMFGLSHLDKKLARQEARAALARVEMLKYADNYPHELSGGEQQRVALARASAPKPAVLLMDEPFSGLDRRLRSQTRAETLEFLRAIETSSVIVTHDPEEAALTADRIVLMRDGKVVQTGTPQEIFEKPVDAPTARFITAVNEFDSKIERGSISTPFGLIPTTLKDNSNVTLMFRPSAMALGHGADGVHDIRGEGGDKCFSNCAKAQVVDVRPLGGEYQIILRMEHINQPLIMRRRFTELPAKGSFVKVCIEFSQIWCYPKSA